MPEKRATVWETVRARRGEEKIFSQVFSTSRQDNLSGPQELQICCLSFLFSRGPFQKGPRLPFETTQEGNMAGYMGHMDCIVLIYPTDLHKHFQYIKAFVMPFVTPSSSLLHTLTQAHALSFDTPIFQTKSSQQINVTDTQFFAKKKSEDLEGMEKSVPLHRFKKAIDCFT